MSKFPSPSLYLTPRDLGLGLWTWAFTLILAFTELLLLVVGILLLILTCGFVNVHFALRGFNCFIQDEHNANFNLSKYEVVMSD